MNGIKKKIIFERLKEHWEVVEILEKDRNFISSLENVVNILLESLSKGGKILICGNGGSAADAQHFAAELVGKFLVKREAIPAIALTTNSSILTAVGNDYNFSEIFSRQVEALGKKEDALVVISTSGNSENVIKAIREAKKKEMVVIGLTGSNKKNEIKQLADYCLCVPSVCTPRIQEMHCLIEHIICELIEERICQK